MDPEEHLILEATHCNRCVGSCHQSPPISFAGKIDSPILVLGQNPGQIQDSDENRLWWANELKSKLIDATTAKMWYDWDYGTSYGQERLSLLFNGNSHDLGYCFSNAVRCRTPGNARPSDEFIINCFDHTKALIDLWSTYNPDPKKRALIVMGNIARWQVFHEELMPWGKIKFTDYGHSLAIMHYTAWRSHYIEYQKTIAELKALISV